MGFDLVPLAVIWLAAPVVALLRSPRIAGGIALVVLVGASAAMLRLLLEVHADGPREVVTGGWSPGVGIRLRADALGVLFTLLTWSSLAAALAHEMAAGLRGSSFPGLVLLLAAGLGGVFGTADAFNFYVFFEVTMIASFVLASYGRGAREVRAALVFTLVNLVGTMLFLVGVSSLYRLTGTLDMAQVTNVLRQEAPGPAFAVAAVLFCALGLKLGLFPFHFWIPGVYHSTTPASGAILAGVVANVGTYGLIRFGVQVLPEALPRAAPVLGVLGGASLLYGGALALSRRRESEVLAYSAIGQVGYVLIALVVGGAAGVGVAILYAIVNGLNKTLLFLTTGVDGAAARAAFLVGGLSVAGLPPTLGFVGKVEIFRAGLAGGAAWAAALAFAGGALSLVYMLQAYQHSRWVRRREVPGEGPRRQLVVGALGAGVVLLGCWPEPLLRASRLAAAAVLPETAP